MPSDDVHKKWSVIPVAIASPYVDGLACFQIATLRCMCACSSRRELNGLISYYDGNRPIDLNNKGVCVCVCDVWRRGENGRRIKRRAC